MSGTNLAANNPALLELLRNMVTGSSVAPTDGLTPGQTQQAVTGNYGNYGTDMPTGQPYGTDVSPYANVPPPQTYDRSTGQGYVNTPSPYADVPPSRTAAAARPEKRPGSPPTPGANGAVAGVVPDDQAGADPLSPRTLIYNYLREKGMPLTSANVRRALEANAANPGAIGGTGRDDAYSNAEMPVHLVNDVAGTDPKTSAAPGQRRLPTPPVPPKLGEEQGPPKPPDQTPTTGFAPNATDLGRWILGRGNPPPPPNYMLELRNPTRPPQLGGPGEGGGGGGGGRPVVPQLPPPSPSGPARLPALPAPSAIPPVTLTPPQAPAATVAPANPAVPPVAMEKAVEPARQPRVTVQQVPTQQAPPISPENPVVKGPVAEGVGKVAAGAGRVAAGAASGLRTGGPRGAVVGGGAAAAKEIIPPLVEQLVKRAARRKAPSKRPVAS